MESSQFIKNVEFVVTAFSASSCRCKFPCEDEYGKFEEYRPHDNWEVWEQDHDNPNFAHYLQCKGCGYQLAKQYWKDCDFRFIDYLQPEPTFINLTLYHIKKAYLYYFNVEVDEFPKTVPYNDVLALLCKSVGILELSKFKEQYNDDNLMKSKEVK